MKSHFVHRERQSVSLTLASKSFVWMEIGRILAAKPRLWYF